MRLIVALWPAGLSLYLAYCFLSAVIGH